MQCARACLKPKSGRNLQPRCMRRQVPSPSPQPGIEIKQTALSAICGAKLNNQCCLDPAHYICHLQWSNKVCQSGRYNFRAMETGILHAGGIGSSHWRAGDTEGAAAGATRPGERIAGRLAPMQSLYSILLYSSKCPIALRVHVGKT